MPILQPEPFVHPDGLLQQPELSTTTGHRWWVMHTRPRTEKSLARVAARENVSYFLPQYIHRWRNKGRLFKSSLPLFPGYLFVHTDDDGRMKLLDTGSIANMLPVSDQKRLQNDLTRIHDLIATGAPLTPEPCLFAGTRVRIISGPMTGMEGVVLRKGKQLRLVLEVHFMQQGVSVEVESWMVAPLVAAVG